METEKTAIPDIAPMDVCIGGVFVGRGERIPDDLYPSWVRRLRNMGLVPEKEPPTERRPFS